MKQVFKAVVVFRCQLVENQVWLAGLREGHVDCIALVSHLEWEIDDENLE